MIELVIKDVDFGSEDLKTFVPDIPDNFCIWLNLSIGPVDADGHHLFQVGVCTPKWLTHQLSTGKPYILKHMILVEDFNFEIINETIQKIVKDAERSSWEKSLVVLCRFFSWEFED